MMGAAWRHGPLLVVGLAGAMTLGGALAAPPASLQISQALATGTEVTAYVAVRDEAGEPVTGIGAGQLHATLGSHAAEVVSVTPFADTGEGVLYLFLVDISRSLESAQFGRLRQALRDWIGALGERDRAALLTFGSQVRTRVAPTADRAALTTALEALAPTDPHTALHQALVQGLALGRQRGADLPARRALIILSDGRDDAPGGMTAEEVEAQWTEGAVPIYAIGFSRARERTVREAGLAALGRFARRSGGLFIDASAMPDPGAAYGVTRARIQAVERLQVRCTPCVADGNRYRLQVSLTQGGLALSDGVEVRLYPPPVTPASAAPPATPPPTEPAPPAPIPPVGVPQSRAVIGWPYGAGALLALVLVGFWWLRVRRARRANPPPASVIPPPKEDGLPSDGPTPRPPAQTSQPSVTGSALTLTFMNGARRGERVRLVLAPDALIGRGSACALALGEDDEVSARHARLHLRDNRVLLEDLGSTNGTWLNGVPVKAPSPVWEGDVLRIGQTELRLGSVAR